MDRFAAPPGYALRSQSVRDCTGCGACCAAPDIHALNKPLGVACARLDAGCRCQIYASRPPVCRHYQPDWVCGEVAFLPTLEARVARFLEIYGLEVNS
ncbi:YkgJ family cysteine cluster protein [Deinococcus frigens]|uniref:YkgJ family cysteine cluster protein n=1 Tax=Deinococcus frigens TaxID=249403 RepID=UPI000497550E|nr:YkgJ family cysteine cluster protein [Deinococcus frigens]